MPLAYVSLNIPFEDHRAVRGEGGGERVRHHGDGGRGQEQATRPLRHADGGRRQILQQVKIKAKEFSSIVADR
jgi:hypothetical protein